MSQYSGEGENGDPLVGSTLGKDFRVIRRIGSGGMAVVYLVEHQSLHKQFAIKILSSELAANLEARARFTQEAHSASALDHENIVTISDFGVTPDHRPFFVMELLRGETLDRRLARGAMSVEEVIAVAVPLARALAYAHAEGIVHRDIKPENVFLVQRSQSRWTVKVVDFGIAKTPANARLTKMGQTLGSPYFMSPEACRGDDVDHRADIYSFGVLLYLMLCGRLPFEDDSLLRVLRMQISEPLPSPLQANPALSPALANILVRALEKHADARHASMEDLLVELEAALPPGSDRLLIEAHNGTTAAFRVTPFPGFTNSQQVRVVDEPRPQARDTVVTAAAGGRWRKWAVAGAAMATGVMLGGAGLVVLYKRSEATPVAAEASAQAALELASTPSGAAIFVDGEPTGLTTPAALRGLSAGRIEIRVELPGYVPETRRFDLAAGASAHHAFALGGGSGRFALGGLPSGAVIVADGEEHAAGEVITLPVGRHDIRVVVAGSEIARQQIDTTSGHQAWELRDRELVRK
jgi:serine/threonine-protein kinase